MKEKELIEELSYLATNKLEEMKEFLEELKDKTYSKKELQEILDNWGEHEIK